jgi:hypothetical protein
MKSFDKQIEALDFRVQFNKTFLDITYNTNMGDITYNSITYSWFYL